MPRFNLAQLRCRLRYRFYDFRHYHRSRRQLLALDDRLLEDIGITREQAKKEGHKAFWQHVPREGGEDENR